MFGLCKDIAKRQCEIYGTLDYDKTLSRCIDAMLLKNTYTLLTGKNDDKEIIGIRLDFRHLSISKEIFKNDAKEDGLLTTNKIYLKSFKDERTFIDSLRNMLLLELNYILDKEDWLN